MSRADNLQAKTPDELRAELKIWEQSFAKANGRKAGREDIRKNAAIAARYKEYDNVRRRSAKPQTTPRKSTKSTPKIAEQNVLRERSANAVAATPSKKKDGKRLQPPELRAVPEEEPTPACVRCALGPTPQKDGAVLGIFDMLSAGTPSKGETSVPIVVPEALIAGTPTKRSAPPSFIPQPSNTPQSSGKRYHLDTFAATPLKRKRDDNDHQASTSKKLFATPSFLRRNWPLARVDEDTHDQSSATAAAGPPFKKRGLVRSMSTIIQSLKKQEEDRMEDEWDIMNELEAEERGEERSEERAKERGEKRATKPAAPAVLVEDSQAPEMPLGPDKGAESSESEGERDPGALDANGNPRKVWKKKGLKRQTRRVIMRPVLQKAKSAPSVLDQGEDERVDETQLSEVPPRRARGEDDDFVDDEEGSAREEKHDSQQSRREKAAKAAPKGKKKAKAAEEVKEQEKKTKKVKPEAHANFRKLKIKNKNSKANGRGGRFGRR